MLRATNIFLGSPMLKPILLALFLFLLSTASQGQQIYGWRAANGVMNYSDSPPTSEARDVKTLKLTPGYTIIPGYKTTSGGELRGKVTSQSGAATASGRSTSSSAVTAGGGTSASGGSSA